MTTVGAAVLLAASLLVAIRVLRPDYDRHLDDVADETDATETEEADAEEAGETDEARYG